jgi:hypothetical protein
VSSGYQKFSARFVSDGSKPKTFASFATFAEEGQNFEGQTDAEKAKVDTPKIQSVPVKVAQVAKVEMPEAVCAVCGAADDLWHFGGVLVHQECAAFLPKPEAEPSAAYLGVTAEPDGTSCRVTIVELPTTGLRYRRTFGHLQLKPPAYIPEDRWRQAIKDGKRFLATWGSQAEALSWDSRDLFGLHTPPDKPHATYKRLSRYDATGLCWLLQSREVVALTAETATIRNPVTGTVTTYRRYNKPSYGPLGDSLDDLDPRWRQ